MKNPDHARFADWDAAYVLGSLSPADRREFEDHLEDCERCRASVQELSALPGLLGRIDDARAFALLEEGDADSAVPDARATVDEPGTEATVVAIRTHERRRKLRRLGVSIGALAAAAALASVLTLVVQPLVTQPDAPDASVSLDSVGDGPQVTMLINAHSVGWGTQLDVDCYYGVSNAGGADASYGPVPYSLWVVDKNGDETSVSTWAAIPNASITFDAATATSLDDIAQFQLRTLDGGQTLLTGDVTPKAS